MEKLKFNPSNKKYYSEEFIKGFECGVERQFEKDKAELTPIILGKWEDTATEIDKKYHRHSLICKNCLRSATYFVNGTEDWWCNELPKYCPNCGRKMKGAEK